MRVSALFYGKVTNEKSGVSASLRKSVRTIDIKRNRKPQDGNTKFMKDNSDIINAKVREIEEKEANHALEKTIKISRKKIWLVVVISILFPLGGYLYTARWKAFLIFTCVFALTGAVIGAGSKNEEEAFEKGVELGSIIGPIAASLDNGLAISRARKKTRELT